MLTHIPIHLHTRAHMHSYTYTGHCVVSVSHWRISRGHCWPLFWRYCSNSCYFVNRLYGKVAAVLYDGAIHFIPPHKMSFYKFWWSQVLNILNESSQASGKKIIVIQMTLKKLHYKIGKEFWNHVNLSIITRFRKVEICEYSPLSLCMLNHKRMQHTLASILTFSHTCKFQVEFVNVIVIDCKKK